MKRMLSLILCSMLFVLSACGETAGSGTDATPTESATVETPTQGTEAEATPQEEKEEPTPEPEVPDRTIKEVFAEHGIKAGTCISSRVIGNTKMEKMVLDQFNSVTMENAMKPDSILNREKSRADGNIVVEYSGETLQLLDWAKANNIPMRGHTLVWYSQTPEWIFHKDFDPSSGLVSREEMLSRMETYIRRNFEELEKLGCLDLFYAYDVVNEAWMEDGTMRKNRWSEIIGDDYLWYAFYYADKYAPESIDLYYNDYNEQYKAEALCKFAETLVDENGRSLIDGIGLQAHFFTADDLHQYFSAIDRLAETGLKLQMTELDVGLGRYQGPLSPTDDNLKKQGKYYYDLINGILERVDSGKIKMDSLTIWGFTDLTSWRGEYSAQLFDKTLAPKYAFYGVIQEKEKAGF